MAWSRTAEAAVAQATKIPYRHIDGSSSARASASSAAVTTVSVSGSVIRNPE